ncbi:MAG: 50S ribosomal protein L10 [Planctomycetes bacterium]|nr:50S ribosomal protein L10 [Planctomycetota bacterium]MCB1375121.1 50S ribosomal protein L10 [Paracoccaceae bacterium]MCB9825821.1 50S ribosomal protein L10 [Planctomycetota bacterium]MCB9829106.1 50S ribosomal protein L10 [Planctomycetota bacterium]MCB9901220.1 50S ribosomal protein L10 [Planctomycetota bacterium]
MAKALKRMMADQLEQALEGKNGLLILETGPMTVESTMAFRGDLREKAGGARLQVIHNRTAQVALNRKWFGEGSDVLDPLLSGPTAIAFGGDGPIPIAKVVRDWSRKWKPLKVKGAVADGELLLAEDASTLADMPDLPQLRAMMLGAVMGVPRGIAVSLSAVYGGLARCLQARVDQQGGGEEATEA